VRRSQEVEIATELAQGHHQYEGKSCREMTCSDESLQETTSVIRETSEMIETEGMLLVVWPHGRLCLDSVSVVRFR
jgi:uncharacterized membrane protein